MTPAKTNMPSDLRPVHVYYTNEEPLLFDSASYKEIEPGLERRITYCTSWEGLSDQFKTKPVSLSINAAHFKNHEFVEVINMVETFARLVIGNSDMTITIAVNADTPHSLIKEAQKSRVIGIIPTSDSFGCEECLRGITAQWANIPYWPKGIIDQLPGAKKPKSVDPRKEISLTSRQQQIYDIIIKNGCSNKHIARLLGITESTVKLHLSNIFKKYGVRNRTQLAVFNRPSNNV